MSFNISEAFNEYEPQQQVIRNFQQVITDVSDGNNITLSMVQRFHAVGLDWAIYNRGIAALTIQIDGQPIDTVAAGGNRISNGIKFDRIVITSTTAYTLYVAGVKL